MANSISKQVKRYLTKHPEASNQELYKKFPKIRQNTLRHYKSRFADEIYTPLSKNTASDKKREIAVLETLKNRVFKYLSESPTLSKTDLHKAFPSESKKSISALHNSFQKSHSIDSSSVPVPVNFEKIPIDKSSEQIQDLECRIEKIEFQVKSLLEVYADSKSHSRLSVIDNIKELEGNIIGFIKDKRRKETNESSTLDELQQFVSNKISSFITGLKIKKK